MSQTFQLPRSTRRADYDVTPGQLAFGPPPWLAFDPVDVAIYRLPAGAKVWQRVTAGVTVTLSASPAGFPTATFAEGQTGGKVRLDCRRVHPRVTDVTRAASLQTPLLERELDMQASVLQELRRDIDDVGDVSAKIDDAVAILEDATQLGTPADDTVTDAKVALPPSEAGGVKDVKLSRQHSKIASPAPIRSMQSYLDQGLTLVECATGPVGSGQNATAALQKLAYECAQLGITGDVGFGDFVVDGPVLFDEQEWADPLNPRGSLRGRGQNSTRLRVVSGGFDGATFEAGSTTGIGSGIVCSDFTLVKDGLDQTGTGIGLNRYAFVTFRDITILGFDAGFFATDMLSSILQGLTVRQCRRGVTLQKNNFSHPNAITLDGIRIGQCKEYGLFASNPSNLNIRGGGIEGCGVGGDGSSGFRGGAYISNGGTEGGNAVNFDGVYFEFNAGTADIFIEHTVNQATYGVEGCTFARGSNADFTINNLLVLGGGSSDIAVDLVRNRFRAFGSYVPNVGRQYINPIGNVTIVESGSNRYDNAGGDPEYRDMALYGPNERRGRINADGTAKFLPRKWASSRVSAGLFKVNLAQVVGSLNDFGVELTLEGGNPGTIRAYFDGDPAYFLISITDLAGAALDAPFAFSFCRKDT